MHYFTKLKSAKNYKFSLKYFSIDSGRVLIKRKDWEVHPKFQSSGSQKFLQIHSHFRTKMKEIEELIVKKDYVNAKPLFIELNDHLDGHHHLEEESIFPGIKKYITEQELKQLEFDHQVLLNHLDKIKGIFNQKESKDHLEESFKKFRNETEYHLKYEEDIVIPVFLSYN